MRQWLLMLLFLASSATADPGPLLRVEPLPDKPLVGQLLPLEIAVLVPGWFTDAIDLPASIPVEGATVRLVEGSSANLNERIDGVSYAGIRRRYEVVATRAGALNIPPFTVRFQWSNGTLNEARTLSTPALTVTPSLPSGMEGLDYVIATPRFELSQTLDRPLRDLKVGDAFTRTLSQRAVGIPAMQLPALLPTPLEGLTVYPDEPVLETRRGERGAADQSLRRQRLTYVLLAEGLYELPGMELTWFDTAAGKVRFARVPALTFSVSPNPQQSKAALPPGAVSPAPTSRQAGWLELARGRAVSLVLVAGLLCALTAYTFQTHRRGRASDGWQRFATPERRAFCRSIVMLLRTDDPAEQLQAIEAWRVAAGSGVLKHACEPKLWQLLAQVHGPKQSPAAQPPKLSRIQSLSLLWRLRFSIVHSEPRVSLDRPFS